MEKKYLQVKSTAPVLNTSDFQSVFGGDEKNRLKTDEKDHIRNLEFIALKNMIFEIVNKTNFQNVIKRITT